MVVYLVDMASVLGSLGRLTLIVLLPLAGALVLMAPGLVSRIHGVAYGVTTTPEGLTEITPPGSRRFVRWEDARLWEMRLRQGSGEIRRL
jgi:hypothetical protein